MWSFLGFFALFVALRFDLDILWFRQLEVLDQSLHSDDTVVGNRIECIVKVLFRRLNVVVHPSGNERSVVDLPVAILVNAQES